MLKLKNVLSKDVTYYKINDNSALIHSIAGYPCMVQVFSVSDTVEIQYGYEKHIFDNESKARRFLKKITTERYFLSSSTYEKMLREGKYFINHYHYGGKKE